MTVLPPHNSIHLDSQEAWWAWLNDHHHRPQGIWLVMVKKDTGLPRITYDEAVETALCFGWIDSKPNKLDETRSLLWFAPRKAKTGWSKPNKERIERAIATGRMMPPGLAKIAAAQQDGSWYALDAIEALEIPEDLVAALANYPNATDNFRAFPRSAKRGILEWISTAKRPETRANRITETARLADQNIRANQWRSRQLDP